MTKIGDASALKVGTASVSAAYVGGTKVWPTAGVFVRDTFTDVNGTLLSAHVGEVGATWAKNPGSGAQNQSITSNRVIGNASGGNSLYTASGSPSTADYTVEGDLVYLSNVAGFNKGIAARCSTVALSGYLFRYIQSTGAWTLNQLNAGAFNVIGTPFVQALTVSQTYHVAITVSGTAITCSVDSSPVISTTDVLFSAAGAVGSYQAGANSAGTTGIVLDNLVATG